RRAHLRPRPRDEQHHRRAHQPAQPRDQRHRRRHHARHPLRPQHRRPRRVHPRGPPPLDGLRGRPPHHHRPRAERVRPRQRVPDRQRRTPAPMSQELKIGLVVLAALVLLFVGIRFLQGLPIFDESYEVVVVFDDTQGLTPGNAVQLSGVEVVTVREVVLADGGREVHVTLAIDPDVEIPRGSRFTVGGFSMLGDVFVSVEPPEGATAGRPLVDGDTLRAVPDTDLVSLLTDRAEPLALRADTLLTSAVNTFRRVEALVEGSGDDLDATLANLRFLTTATTRLLLEERER